MRRLLSILLLFSLVSLAGAQPPYVSEIKSQRGEHWWGLYVGDGSGCCFSDPFSAAAESCGRGFFTVPMMVSSNGRYIWSNEPFHVIFDSEKFTLTSGHENIKVQKGGKNLREAYLVCYHNNIRVSGETPPEELFTRPVYDISIEEPVAPGAEKLNGYASLILDAGLPAGTFIIPRGWESLSAGLDFSRDLYPEPTADISGLHSKGFKVMLTLSPYIPAYGKRFAEAASAGKLLLDGSGSPVVFKDRGGYSACLDFSLPAVSEEFIHEAKLLMERYGVDGFMLDCKEIIPYLTGDLALLKEFVENWNGVGTHFDMKIYSSVFYSPGTAVVTGLGDMQQTLSWNSLAEAACNPVSAGLSGYIHPYYQMGNIDSDTDEELLLRAIQLAMSMTVAVLPPSAWKMKNRQYSEEVMKAVGARENLTEYMTALVRGSGSTAEPLARHMAYQYPNQGFYNCTDQFMLGTKYIVAPVLDNSGKRTVRLPRGVWISPDGQRHRGPRVMDVDVSDGQALVYELQGR